MRKATGMQGYLTMQDVTEHKVGDSLSQIECFRCGVCCARNRPKATPQEIERIARKLGVSVNVFTSTYVRAAPAREAYILQNSADTCPFLRWDERKPQAACSIHAFRPTACRNWAASLSRPECREGLTKLKANGGLLQPHDLYESGNEIERLSAAMKDDKIA